MQPEQLVLLVRKVFKAKLVLLDRRARLEQPAQPVLLANKVRKVFKVKLELLEL